MSSCPRGGGGAAAASGSATRDSRLANCELRTANCELRIIDAFRDAVRVISASFQAALNRRKVSHHSSSPSSLRYTVVMPRVSSTWQRRRMSVFATLLLSMCSLAAVAEQQPSAGADGDIPRVRIDAVVTDAQG